MLKDKDNHLVYSSNYIEDMTHISPSYGFSGQTMYLRVEPSRYEEELEEARDIAIESMKEKAERLGANAIIGIKISYDNLGGTMGNTILVTAYGTAIKYE